MKFKVLEDGSTFFEKARLQKNIQIKGKNTSISENSQKLLEDEKLLNFATQMRQCKLNLNNFVYANQTATEQNNTIVRANIQFSESVLGSSLGEKEVYHIEAGKYEKGEIIPGKRTLKKLFITAKPSIAGIPMSYSSFKDNLGKITENLLWCKDECGYGEITGEETVYTSTEYYVEEPHILRVKLHTHKEPPERDMENFCLLEQHEKAYYELTFSRLGGTEGDTLERPIDEQITIIIATECNLLFYNRSYNNFYTDAEEPKNSRALIKKYEKTIGEKKCNYYVIKLWPATYIWENKDRVMSNYTIGFTHPEQEVIPFSILIEYLDILWQSKKGAETTYSYDIFAIHENNNQTRLFLKDVPGHSCVGKGTLTYSIPGEIPTTIKENVEVTVTQGSRIVTLPEGVSLDGLPNILTYKNQYYEWAPPEKTQEESIDNETVGFYLWCTGASTPQLANPSPLTIFQKPAKFQYQSSEGEIKTVECYASLTIGKTTVSLYKFNSEEKLISWKPDDVKRSAFVIVTIELANL